MKKIKISDVSNVAIAKANKRMNSNYSKEKWAAMRAMVYSSDKRIYVVVRNQNLLELLFADVSGSLTKDINRIIADLDLLATMWNCNEIATATGSKWVARILKKRADFAQMVFVRRVRNGAS